MVGGNAADCARHSRLPAQSTLKTPPVGSLHGGFAQLRPLSQVALDLPSWSPFSQPWQSECRRGGELAGSPSGAGAAEEGGGGFEVAVPPAHYPAVHHGMKDSCCQDGDKHAAVSADVIALMKRSPPGRGRPLPALAPGGWRDLSRAPSPCPRRTEVWVSGEEERCCA